MSTGSNAEKFERGRWSLFVEFDSYEIQAEPGREMLHPLGEKAALEAYVLWEFGGLPEEIHEILRHCEDGRVEVSTDVVDFLFRIMEWIGYHTIPREVKLVRNQER